MQVGFPVGDVRVRRARERKKERMQKTKRGAWLKITLKQPLGVWSVSIFVYAHTKKVQPSNLFADKFHGQRKILANGHESVI